MGTEIPSWSVFVGMLNLSSEAVVVTLQGLAIKSRAANVRRIRESESADRMLELFRGLRMAVTLHSTFKSEGASLPRRSVDGKQSSEDLPSQSRLRTTGPQ